MAPFFLVCTYTEGSKQQQSMQHRAAATQISLYCHFQEQREDCAPSSGFDGKPGLNAIYSLC